jgi:ribosomal protein L7/L12
MQIVEVVPKEIHVLIELSLKEINHLLNALDHATIGEACKKEDSDYLKEKFFNTLDKLADDLKAHYES